VHTSRWIIDKCFSGDLLRNRTVILVTHNVALAGPLAQHVVSIGSDGVISSQTTIGEALSHDGTLRAEVFNEIEVLEKADQVIEGTRPKESAPQGKLVAAEELALGHVTVASGVLRVRIW